MRADNGQVGHSDLPFGATLNQAHAFHAALIPGETFADVLQESVKSDVSIVETVAHMMSATHYFGDIDVVCDIGGQDIKVLFMANGELRNFRLAQITLAATPIEIRFQFHPLVLAVLNLPEMFPFRTQ
jgi:hypothetical protein